MDLQSHTTPESRKLLRAYLSNRRLTASLHNRIILQALSDLEESLRLLRGINHPSTEWVEEVESFVAVCAPPPSPDLAQAIPGLFDGH
jgi:hypothetical protein